MPKEMNDGKEGSQQLDNEVMREKKMDAELIKRIKAAITKYPYISITLT